MPGRQHEAVAVGPAGDRRGMAKEPGPQAEGHRRHAHRRARDGPNWPSGRHRSRGSGSCRSPAGRGRPGQGSWCSPGDDLTSSLYGCDRPCPCCRPRAAPRGYPRNRAEPTDHDPTPAAPSEPWTARPATDRGDRRPDPRRGARAGPADRARYRRARSGSIAAGWFRGEHGALARPPRCADSADLRGGPGWPGPGTGRGRPGRRCAGPGRPGCRPADRPDRGPRRRATGSGRSWPIGAPPTGSRRTICGRPGLRRPSCSTCRCTRSWANRSARPVARRSGWPAAPGRRSASTLPRPDRSWPVDGRPPSTSSGRSRRMCSWPRRPSSERCWTFATAAELAGRALALAPVVVVKRGAHGASVHLLDAGGASVTFEVATRPLPAADSTGAGDAFDAGFLIGFVDDRRSGRSTPAGLRRAVLAGHRVAARHLAGPYPELDLR